MALGDGSGWDETTPVDASLVSLIDDYDRDLRIGIRSRMALEHEFPASQAATSQAGVHKFVTVQQVATQPTLAGTQIAGVYVKTVGTQGNELFYARSGTGAAEVQVTNGAGINATIPAGTSIQTVNYQRQDEVACATVIPVNNSARTSAEGNQVLTLKITPSSATNKLHIDVRLCGNSGVGHVCAILMNGTTVLCTSRSITENTYPNQIAFSWYMTTGVTTELTFNVNAGNSAGTYTLNGTSYDAGKIVSSITITEIKV